MASDLCSIIRFSFVYSQFRTKPAGGPDRKWLSVKYAPREELVASRRRTERTLVNLFASVGYFEDPVEDRQVLANIGKSLKPGGRAASPSSLSKQRIRPGSPTLGILNLDVGVVPSFRHFEAGLH